MFSTSLHFLLHCSFFFSSIIIFACVPPSILCFSLSFSKLFYSSPPFLFNLSLPFSFNSPFSLSFLLIFLFSFLGLLCPIPTILSFPYFPFSILHSYLSCFLLLSPIVTHLFFLLYSSLSFFLSFLSLEIILFP